MHNGAYGAAAHTNTHEKIITTETIFVKAQWLSNSRVSHMKDHSWHSGAFCYPGRQKTTLKRDNAIQKPIRSNSSL